MQSLVDSAYWQGETGRVLRKQGAICQLVGVYLMTSPCRNLIGMYRQPLAQIVEEVAGTKETISSALESLDLCSFAYYDFDEENVWLPELARYQIGKSLTKTDNRWKGVIKVWQAEIKSPFYEQFYERYKDVYHLPPLEDVQSVPPKQPVESATKEKQPEPQGAKRFRKPTVEEVAAYATELGYQIDAEQFVDFYESKGWKVGSTAMKDWKAAVRNWQRGKGPEATGSRSTRAARTTQAALDFIQGTD